MAWTYSGNPSSSPRDHVRFLIGDTVEQAPLMTDEEIDFLLSNNPAPAHAAVGAVNSMIASVTREVDYTIGPESVKASQRLTNLLALKKLLQSSIQSSNAAPSWDDSIIYDRTRPIFEVGMDDDPAAPRRYPRWTRG